ncbi:hypothetical protein KR200_011138 [Drosophila serrata]|nr:hypothetical protein KR200_011138 [Drosophila serrata]
MLLQLNQQKMQLKMQLKLQKFQLNREKKIQLKLQKIPLSQLKKIHLNLQKEMNPKKRHHRRKTKLLFPVEPIAIQKHLVSHHHQAVINQKPKRQIVNQYFTSNLVQLKQVKRKYL